MYRIMEICGGHTNVIMKYGLREKFADVKLISGPGCPVCVTSQKDIDSIIELAKHVPVATYGDMMRVPGSTMSLDDARAKGCRVFEVYSTTEVIKLNKEHENIVFFGVGFETTAPMTAYLLQHDICVYSVHKLVPPAMNLLDADGFLDPGHVATIIGSRIFESIHIPQVITGFKPEQVVRAIDTLISMLDENRTGVINQYDVVKHEGNKKALKLLKDNLKIVDAGWRGFGKIPASGFEVKNDLLNARLRFHKLLSAVPEPKKTSCRCAEILTGSIEPDECALFNRGCTPADPKGACMVSAEGACAIHFTTK